MNNKGKKLEFGNDKRLLQEVAGIFWPLHRKVFMHHRTQSIEGEHTDAWPAGTIWSWKSLKSSRKLSNLDAFLAPPLSVCFFGGSSYVCLYSCHFWEFLDETASKLFKIWCCHLPLIFFFFFGGGGSKGAIILFYDCKELQLMAIFLPSEP